MDKLYFSNLVEHGNLDEAKVYLRNHPDFVITDHYLFDSCKNGRLEMAKWLLSFLDIDNVSFDFIFCASCENGHDDVAKWLWSINPNLNIHFNHDHPFYVTCKHGHINTAKFLCSLSNKFDLEISNNKIIQYKVK